MDLEGVQRGSTKNLVNLMQNKGFGKNAPKTFETWNLDHPQNLKNLMQNKVLATML